jgi:uncharacterized radical SAM protein YgiQ
MSVFLPVTVDEVKKLGWNSIDVVFFTGDAYIDHPSFGTAIIARLLESLGLRVAIVPQPNWQDDLRDFKKFGKPNLFFAVSAGNMDSMVNHYTANKFLRHDDAYTPGNRYGARPDYAVTVYCNILKKLYPDTPIVIGGIEASLRRLAHYDYWSNTIKPSILVESKADLLLYGMAEKAVKELVLQLKQKKQFSKIIVNQSAILTDTLPNEEYILLPSYEECKENLLSFAKAYRIIEENANKYFPDVIVQPHGDKYVVVKPPYHTTQSELDEIYSLPYTYLPHPKYNKKPPIPAFEMIKNSITIHRGCFGGCSFCSLAIHQGKFVVSRSIDSILAEVEKLKTLPYFKGHIRDLGGPSANMYGMIPINTNKCKKCKRPSCIYPNICSNLNTDPTKLLELYRKISSLSYVKKLTIGSGIRYDIHIRLMKNNQKHKEYLTQVIRHHVSGRLKVAPEHIHDDVLKLMFKPSFKYFEEFYELFNYINNKYNLKQQLVPYFISNHPGCTIYHMKQLSEKLKQLNIKPEQVQDFTPTPMTLASIMYACELNPYTLKKIYVAKDLKERILQKEMFFWYKNSNKKQINKKLLLLHKKEKRRKKT